MLLEDIIYNKEFNHKKKIKEIKINLITLLP